MADALSIIASTLRQWFVIGVKTIPAFIIATIIVVVGYAVSRFARRWITRAIERRTRVRPRLVAAFFGKLVQWAMMIGTILIALVVLNPSFQFKDIINTLGISGIVIGFAFKDILQNFISGLLLMLQEPFTIGETIEVGKGGYEGEVVDIEVRATILKEKNTGNRIIVPNSEIFTKTVRVIPIASSEAWAPGRSASDMAVTQNSRSRPI
jgi:small conductance mechanosensitive channel